MPHFVRRRAFRGPQWCLVGWTLLLLVGPVWGADVAVQEIQEVPDGTILNQSNWEMARGVLPDEVLELYKKGEDAHPIRKLENAKGTVQSLRMV